MRPSRRRDVGAGTVEEVPSYTSAMTKPTPHRIPEFASVDEERRYRKEHLAAAFRVWARLGYDEGVAGHITVRDPERTDHFWVNPFGLHFGLISVSDLILVNHAGEVVDGDWPVNRAAFCIHAAIHQARPDVVAAAHCHSVHGKAWSSLGRLLDPAHAGRVRLLRGSWPL